MAEFYMRVVDGRAEGLPLPKPGIVTLASGHKVVATHWSDADLAALADLWPVSGNYAAEAHEATGGGIFDAAAGTVMATVTSKPLAGLRERYLTLIDAAAEMARACWLTPGAGQALVYQAKEAEARAAAAAGASADPADYPHLAAEIGVTAADLAAVSQVVLATAAAWRQVSAQIEGQRLTAKAAVRAAADVAAIRAVLAGLTWPTP